ncbi:MULTISPECIES: PadR family transcriptional regulator [Streptomyces]|uniref:PadR family transcriptional regulator n=1 Tax=Streptomyces TaxID=1883 RepID=UPI001CCE4330|nr:MULTISPECIES: PadR family transcriptional regulator [Streptomyces]MCM8550820.1 PadR family transcriptional regulator [Streptomyces sp. STCH 565 A]MCU8591160.1 PadR family transcriptional regulator [Streptomyces sp. A13(2022)]UOG81659.1 PadR family transcriptional regulator [Streptomyces sp. CB09030]GHI97308.1 PadR family transcriptional regulator [Streptomyces olivaceus]
MSLPHAILTALVEKPSSGLELTRRFDKSIAYFWSATHQQIYRELGKLEADGLIRALPGEQPARGQKKSYEVLPAGREELARWTAAAQDPKPLRDAMLLRLRAAAVVGTTGIEADLRRHLELHERQLAEYEEIERRDFPPGRDSPEDRLRHLVLRAGLDLEAFWTRWLEHALAEFAELPGDGPARDTRSPSPARSLRTGTASSGGAGTRQRR